MTELTVQQNKASLVAMSEGPAPNFSHCRPAGGRPFVRHKDEVENFDYKRSHRVRVVELKNRKALGIEQV